MKSIKGQGMSTNTIILLILGLVILAVLVLGFSTGWKSFKNIASPSNVDSVVEDCQTVCGLDQKFSFCSAERTLRVNEENLEIKTSCKVLANIEEFAKYGIQDCPSIQCDLTEDTITIEGKIGTTSVKKEDYDLSSII